MFLPVASVTLGAEPKDPVQAGWSARAELAKRRLAKGGLDACDAAVEKAFQAAKQTQEMDWRTFDLSIDVGGQVLLALYRYQGNQLDSFALVALPPQWVAYQKAESKTLRFILGPPQNCAFSLCTRGPTDDGPCAEKTRP
ncbi:MAG TPA: hypothetical protein VMT11_21440 [Myxococcaceae bacterium]|nr:hypothetical protein [Myxococcaceae bacterium]